MFCEFCGRVAKNNMSYSQHRLKCKNNPNRLQIKILLPTIEINCEFCNRPARTLSSYRQHKCKCSLNPSNLNLSKNDLTCNFCNRIAKNIDSNRQHKIRCKKNPDRIFVVSNLPPLAIRKKSNQYIKGTAKPWTPEQSAKASEKGRITSNAYYSKPENRQKQSEIMKSVAINNPESYNSSNRGRTKQIIYDGIKFQGNWELDFYKWAKDQKLPITRVTQGFSYQFNGTRTYYPDFYIESLNLYIEIKGYETDKDKAKWRDFPHRLYVVRQKEINSIRKNNTDSILSDMKNSEN